MKILTVVLFAVAAMGCVMCAPVSAQLRPGTPLSPTTTPPAVTLEQVISHENPLFNCTDALLAVGQDGLVYVYNSGQPAGYVIRVSPGGDGKFGGAVHYANNGVAVDSNGIMAVASAHFAHQVQIFDKQFRHYADGSDFLIGDAFGFDAPGHVEPGANNTFLALDQHKDRIERLDENGKTLTIYAIPRPTGVQRVNDFRVCEKTQSFYVWPYAAPIRCVGFDGVDKFTPSVGSVAGWDVDTNGVIYTISADGTSVHAVGPDGKVIGDLRLQMGDLAPTSDHPITSLRVFGNRIFIKRRHPSEMFQVYDMSNGKFIDAVSIDKDTLSVTYARDVWTAGQPMPFTITFAPSQPRPIAPAWRIWIRPYGTTDYREIKIAAGAVTVPSDATGLYNVRVSPESDPNERGEVPDYILQSVVDIRAPSGRGSASVVTPDNRIAYAAGEDIPFTIKLRGDSSAMPSDLTLKLVKGEQTIAARAVALTVGQSEFNLDIPASLTRELLPGEYKLAISGTNLTGVGQALIIGAQVRKQPFHTVQYGDYGLLFPGPDFASLNDIYRSPDAVAQHIARTDKLGFNLLVDRLGIPLNAQSFMWDNRVRYVQDNVVTKLRADNRGTSPDRAVLPVPMHQTFAQYGGNGIDEMSILMSNDAGLPIGGPGFDGRKMDQILIDLDRVNKDLSVFPAFRGWTWSSNWWIFGGRGADAATNDADKAAYKSALLNAKSTGAWDPILDKVNAIPFGYAGSTQQVFNDELHKISSAPLVTASAAPYRNVQAWPPLALGNVDEVDLHIQWEQLGPPYFAPNNVDYYTRPGKPSWAHPEVWNDDGTGGQVLPEEFEMVERGAAGVGESGPLPPWNNQPDDSREGYQGQLSIYRAMNAMLKDYGPWLTTLHNDDRVAIVASARMYKTDDWPTDFGTHFGRVFEAYVACLRAHYPATIVFTDDMKTADALAKYKAILVIDQRFDMEPELVAALQGARAAGSTIFYDGNCLPSIVAGFRPLGVTFKKIEKDPATHGDDDAYWRFPEYIDDDLPAVRAALGSVVQPVADCGNSNIMLSQRTGLGGRFVFAVNDTRPNYDPAKMWKVTLRVTSLQPLLQPIKLLHPTQYVYDIFSLKRVQNESTIITADMRALPMRIYAILPAAIGTVSLRGPASVRAGESFRWATAVRSAAGQIIDASIPVKLRLLASNGDVLDEHSTADAGAATDGEFTVPVNSPAGPVTLEATELFSGKTARLSIPISESSLPIAFAAIGNATPVNATKPVTGSTPGDYPAAETRFGPHFRDVALAGDGKVAVLNNLSWGENVYGIDTATGKVSWHNRIGDFYAYAPMTFGSGVAVQGFDFNSAEGYHLYTLSADGSSQRRFALYGMARRAVHRFVPGILNDHMNQFTAPKSGAWVATAGDLGLAVWSQDGTLLWQQDWWKQNRSFARYNDTQKWSNVTLFTPIIAAPSDDTLLVADGPVLTNYEADSGKQRWQMTLGANGTAHKILVSPDLSTVALVTTTEGGRIYIIQDGKLLQTLTTSADDGTISPDNQHIVLVNGQQIKSYTIGSGLAQLPQLRV